MNLRKRRPAFGVLLCVGIANSAAAQESAPIGLLGEVVVTAQRREENLQTTPVAVTALSAEDLARRGVDDIVDLDQHVVNLSMISGQGGGSTQMQMSIRGVGQSDFILTADQSVGLYLDGVYIPRSIGAALDLVDIQRVEVLRGPQGTLFGRNTTAGAVQIIPQPPQEGLSGTAEVTAGSYERLDVKASANVPLGSDRVLSRFSVASLNQDGYGDRLFQGTDGGDKEVLAGRAHFRMNMAEDWLADLVVDGSRRRGHGGLETLVNVDPTDPNMAFYNFLLTSQGLAPVDERWITDDVHDTWSSARNRDDNDIAGASLTFTRENETLGFKSISAYRSLSAQSSYSFAPSPYPVAEQNLDLDQEQWSQEFQFSGRAADRLDWIAGLYYFHEGAEDFQNVPFFQPVVATGDGGFTRVPGGFSFDSFISQDTDSYAAFGQATYRFTDKLSGTLGARYTHEEKELFSYLQWAFVRPPGTVKESWSDVSPRVGLEYEFSPALFGYVTASRGFRSGGFNGRNTSPFPPESYDPEKVLAYELGLKLQPEGGLWRLNTAAYYYDYSDFQGLTLSSFTGITITVGNIAEVEIWGVEMELQAHPHERLALGIAGGYNSHDIKRIDPNASITIRPDTNLVNAPEWTGSAYADLTLWSGESLELLLHGSLSYKSRVEFFLPNYPDEGQSGYTLGNARLVLQPQDERWSIELFGNNLGDEEYRVFAENGTALGVAATSAIFGPPLEWGVRLRHAFK